MKLKIKLGLTTGVVELESSVLVRKSHKVYFFFHFNVELFVTLFESHRLREVRSI